MKKKLFTLGWLCVFCITPYLVADQNVYTQEEAERIRNEQKEKAVAAEQTLLAKIHHMELTQSDSSKLLKAIDRYKAQATQFNGKTASDEVRKISTQLSLSSDAQGLLKDIALAASTIESTGFLHKPNEWKRTNQIFFDNAKGLLQTIISQQISNNDTQSESGNTNLD